MMLCASMIGDTVLAATSVDVFVPACVFLRETEQSPSKFGSGFFVSEGGRPLLITAAHVAEPLSLTSPFVIARVDGSPAVFSLQDLVPEKSKLEWILHDHADVAVLPLFPEQDFLEANLKGHFIKSEWIETRQVAPDRESTITVLGFPLILLC